MCLLRTYVETQSPLHAEQKQSTFFLPEYIAADTIKKSNRFVAIETNDAYSSVLAG